MNARFVIKQDTNGYDHFNVLVDTQTGEEVFCDLMEPEDALLTRDLSPLVDLLNQLAGELVRTEQAG